jgi:hypothetical protein
MKTRLIKKWSACLIASLLGVCGLFAAPYEKGQAVELFKAEDQYGTAFALEPSKTKFVLVSHDMETGKRANAALSALGKEFLPDRKAVYVANIDGMPAIGRMFAIPKMKKYSHRIILCDDAALIARFPQQTGKVTVLTLANGKVQSIAYWTPGTNAVGDYLK